MRCGLKVLRDFFPVIFRRRDQEARRSELLLPHLRVASGVAEGEGPHRRLRAGGGLGDPVWRDRAFRAHRYSSHQRDRHVPGLRQVDPVLPRPANQAQPVEQRRGTKFKAG